MNARQQNAASPKPVPFFLRKSIDHLSGVTGLGTNPAVSISKNGGAFGSATGGVVELANGWYAWNIATGDCDTLGELAVHITGTGADPRDFTLDIIVPDPFAAQFGLTNLDVPTSTRLAAADIESDNGTAQSGSTTNIRLRAGAPANDLTGQSVYIKSGAGAGESSRISAYNTSTKDATTTWQTAPDATSVYVVFDPQGGSGGGGGSDPLLNAVPGSYGAGTAGAALGQISSIKTKTDLIGVAGAVALTTGPVNGVRTMEIGMDYKAADGLAVIVTAPAGWPSFSGGSNPQLYLYNFPAISGSILSATQLSFDVPRTVLANMSPISLGPSTFRASVTLASGDVVWPEKSQLVLQ